MAGINESKTMLTVNIAVLTVSDTRTLDNDKSGNVLVERIENAGHHLAGRRIIRDDIDVIVAALNAWIDDGEIDVVIATGGTGVTGRDVTPEALIKDIDVGFYVTELIGMGVNGVTGDYSRGASGFWIENGTITYPVSELTVAGNLKDMFQNITPADDLTFRYGVDAPTLRVEGLTVAGQ